VSVWVEDHLTVHQESVLVVAMVKWHLQEPGSIRLASHRMCRRIPTVELASQEHRLRVPHPANKVNGFGHPLGGITVGGKNRANRLLHVTATFTTESVYVTNFIFKTKPKAKQQPPWAASGKFFGTEFFAT
jgi:hypothetical protein